MTEEVTREVPLAYTIQPLQRIKIAELCPLTGTMTSVAMHFPRNCSGYVHVAFGHGEVWVAPSEINTFISLDDATPVFPTSEPVRKNEHLWADMSNGDGANPHRISIIVTIVGRDI